MRYRPTPKIHEGGATEQDYLTDRFDCIRQAQQTRTAFSANQYGAQGGGGTFISKGMFLNCMAAKGYRVDPKGDLQTPPENVVQMVE